MTNITENEMTVLRAFPICTEDYNDVKEDLGQSWTEASELATETGKSKASINATIGSLLRKGLIHSDEKPNGQAGEIQCLSEAGCDVLAEAYPVAKPEAPADAKTAKAEIWAYMDANPEATIPQAKAALSHLNPRWVNRQHREWRYAR